MPNRLLYLALPAVVLTASGWAYNSLDDYQVSVTLASATNVVAGGPVLVNGFEAGTVDAVEVEQGQAVVTLTLDEEFTPLHEGAVVEVRWKATLSERQIEIVDGADSSPEVPDGGAIPGSMAKPTEIDDVLNALDAPTRAKVSSLVGRLAGSLSGNERGLESTLQTSGPALRQLGELMQAVGTDGPAIRNLVSRMNQLMNVVAERDGDLQQVVDHLASLTGRVAAERGALRESLVKLPPTLRQAQTTLGSVPSTVDEVEPLLRDLGPATASLRPVVRNLRPLLRDLRPLTGDLQPALSSLRQLLGITPDLLDGTQAVLPGAEQTLKGLREPVAFMRPYTPEMTAFFSTWASAFGNYDSNGNFARIFGQAGTTSFNENPGIVPPGVTYDPYPEPGAVVKQPWTDAHGSEIR